MLFIATLLDTRTAVHIKNLDTSLEFVSMAQDKHITMKANFHQQGLEKQPGTWRRHPSPSSLSPEQEESQLQSFPLLSLDAEVVAQAVPREPGFTQQSY